MKFPRALAVLAAPLFGTMALHGQVLLDVDITPTTITVTATGVGPVTLDSSHTFNDGIDLEGLFAPGAGGIITTVASTLTTGDSSTGPVYDTAVTDSLSEPNADLNLYNENTPTESFTFGQPAFALGTSTTLSISGVTFSGIDYGVIVAGYSGFSEGSNNPVPIGVYHVTGATPEPSTYAMMLGGLALLGLCVRRKLA
jgi:hypothetical protein